MSTRGATRTERRPCVVAGRRGFTLIELMIATAIAAVLTTAAVLFAMRETRTLDYSGDRMAMQQSARTALDLLVYDIQLAGAGMGKDATGNFAGLKIGAFTALGGLSMNASGSDAQGAYTRLNLTGSSAATGAEVDSGSYGIPTEDLGLFTADGGWVTIAAHAGTSGQFCNDPSVTGTQQRYAIMEDNVRLGLQAVLVTPGNVAACTDGQCRSGCRAFSIAPITPNTNPAYYISAANAPTLNYTGGELRTGLKQVIWFVEPDSDRPYTANLRRAELTPFAGCPAGSRATCGSEVAYGVETMQYAVWRFDKALPDNATTPTVDERWVVVGPPFSIPLNSGDRLRVDLEVVVRSERAGETLIPQARLALRPMCVPGTGTMAGCSPPGNQSQWDRVYRRVHRVSVEVKNTW